MRELLLGLAQHIRDTVVASRSRVGRHYVSGAAQGGDAEFPVDVVAEQAAADFLRRAGQPVACYTESAGLTVIGDDPRHVLIIDPIDGTRAAAADLEMACVSIAAAPYPGTPTIGDITHAVLTEVKTGNWLYADENGGAVESGGYPDPVPRLSDTSELERMFWSLEFNGHPARMMVDAYGHLIDASANRGAVYVFNSASFSLSRIVTGQMDAYVDIGNRILRDRPESETEFRRVGHGNILHLFPYDIAAAVFIAERAGVVVTDAYGKSLHDTVLLDISPLNQQSCIAASTSRLHELILENIRW
ncbi:inositol monophosphatase family protein [Micromonospora sp. RB23]